MVHDASGDGLWPLVLINTVAIVLFAVHLLRSRSRWDWRGFTVVAAVFVALVAWWVATLWAPASDASRSDPPGAA